MTTTVIANDEIFFFCYFILQLLLLLSSLFFHLKLLQSHTVNFEVNFNLFSLLQPNNKIKETFSKIC